MKALLALASLAVCYHVVASMAGDKPPPAMGGGGAGGGGGGGGAAGGGMGGRPPPKRAVGKERRTSEVGGREGMNDMEGRFELRAKTKKMSLLLRGYQELDESNQMIEQHSGENTTSLVNSEPADEMIPHSVLEGTTTDEKVPAVCLTSTVTFESGTVAEVKSCIVKRNGTIELGSEGDMEVITVRPGFGKVSVKISSHTWCDPNAVDGTENCGDNVMGKKLKLQFEVKANGQRPMKQPRGQGMPGEPQEPGEPHRKRRAAMQGKRKPPKIYAFGNSQMLLSTKAAVLMGGDENTVKEWVDLGEDGADVAEDGDSSTASFIIPRPSDPTLNIWYDPTMDLEGEDLDSSAPKITSALLTTITAILSCLLML